MTPQDPCGIIAPEEEVSACFCRRGGCWWLWILQLGFLGWTGSWEPNLSEWAIVVQSWKTEALKGPATQRRLQELPERTVRYGQKRTCLQSNSEGPDFASPSWWPWTSRLSGFHLSYLKNGAYSPQLPGFCAYQMESRPWKSGSQPIPALSQAHFPDPVLTQIDGWALIVPTTSLSFTGPFLGSLCLRAINHWETVPMVGWDFLPLAALAEGGRGWAGHRPAFHHWF